MKKQYRNKYDMQIYEKEIQPYLPAKIFDAHSHLLKTEFHDYNEDNEFFYDVEINDLRNYWDVLFPDSQINGLIFGTPFYNCDFEAENNFVAKSINDDKNRFSLMVKPQMSSKYLEDMILKYKPSGLKPYLVHALVEDKQNARITDFITEEQIDIANKFGLSITLHVSKLRGMADPENLEDISRLINQYPKVQFILAHCGRCFISVNMADTLDELPIADNLWLDTSAVCETGVFLELFSRYDTSRIIYGSDLVNPVAFRGTYVGLGMSWHPVTPDRIIGFGQLESMATFAVYENLRSLLHAAKHTGLSQNDIQNIFFNNSKILFNL